VPTTLSSREFNQNASEAKRAAERGPVFITDRGRPAHVLLSIADYQRLTAGGASLAEQLAWPGAELLELALPARRDAPRHAILDD
jgi:prevent-host-death family protein